MARKIKRSGAVQSVQGAARVIKQNKAAKDSMLREMFSVAKPRKKK